MADFNSDDLVFMCYDLVFMGDDLVFIDDDLVQASNLGSLRARPVGLDF